MKLTKTYPCNADHLELLIRGELSLSDEQNLDEHLEQCNACREALERLAAEPETWHEAGQLLQPSEFVSPSSRTEIRDDSLAEESGIGFGFAPQVRVVIDALAPTDDPTMLGRLGAYEISGVIGAGGMGVVLKAIDASLDRVVAIKVLAPHLATTGAARRRFERESKAAAAVLHPNVVAIHSVSQSQSLPFLVMPYIRGHSLQQRLNQQGPLPVTAVLRIGSQIAAGLSAAHAQGLVHRDIKPANILLEEGVERVAITDFGLARAVDDATLTRSGVIAGTPQYMSPEQSRGESVGSSSDLFSLGSVMYAMCTGRPPFRAETTFGVIRRICEDCPTPIRELSPDIPQWLAGFIERLMEKQPEKRFESAAEVHEQLEQCLAHLHQPDAVALPSGASVMPKPKPATKKGTLGGRPSIGAAGLNWNGLKTLSIVAGSLLAGMLAMLGWQLTEAPDIAGRWSGDQWGHVILKKSQAGVYSGTYSERQGDGLGQIRLKWSRIERRFNGTWTDGDLRHGKLSIRLVGKQIQGAWTTSRDSRINPATPNLADLVWKPETGNNKSETLAEANKEKAGGDQSNRASSTGDRNQPVGPVIDWEPHVHPWSGLGNSSPWLSWEEYRSKFAEQVEENPLDLDPSKPNRLILHVCDASGIPIRPLIKDEKLRRTIDRQGTPDVSPDGKKVAFDGWSTNKSWKYQSGQVVIVDIDGDNAHVICDGFMPSFSPDGKRFVFSRTAKYAKADGAQGRSIWIANIDGSEKRMIVDGGAWGARWSPDGKSLVFYGGVNDEGKKVKSNCLRLYDFATKTTRNVFEPDESPFKSLRFHFEWSKKGNRRLVAFAGNLKTTGKRVTAVIDVDAGLDSMMIFDYDQIYHGLCYDFHPTGDLMVTGNKNGQIVPMLISGLDGELKRMPGFPSQVTVRDFAYTPDGRQIIAAFQSTSSYEP